MTKKRVLLAGDSWGVGEWLPAYLSGNSEPGNPHEGLAQYMKEDGHHVWNISQPAISNLAITERIANWMVNFHDLKVDFIIMFATEYTRDMDYEFPIEVDKIKDATELSGICLSRSYYRLRDISQKYNVPIYLVGGCVDTIWLDNWQDVYTGVHVICQSMVNLILNNKPRTDNPVFSWYGVKTEKTVRKLKSILAPNEVEVLINLMDQGFRRQSLIFENPKWFWPDGVHPNRKAHKKLFDFLQQQKLFD